jgi:hypothetical protein
MRPSSNALVTLKLRSIRTSNDTFTPFESTGKCMSLSEELIRLLLIKFDRYTFFMKFNFYVFCCRS